MLTFLASIENEEIRSKIEEAYYLYRKELLYKAYDVIKDVNEAEDIVQSAFIKFANRIDGNVDIKCNKTRGLLVIIVRRLAIDIYRKSKRKTIINVENIDNLKEEKEEYLPEPSVLRLDKSEQIAKKLAKIKGEYADILTLKYTYGYSNREIAEICNINEINVRVRLNRARNALRKIIGDDAYEEE